MVRINKYSCRCIYNTTGLQVKRVYIHMGCHKKTRVNIWFSTTSGFFKGSSRCYILVLTLSHTHTRYWSSTYYKHTNLWLGIYLPLGKELIWKIVGYSHRLCIVRSQLMCGTKGSSCLKAKRHGYTIPCGLFMWSIIDCSSQQQVTSYGFICIGQR